MSGVITYYDRIKNKLFFHFGADRDYDSLLIPFFQILDSVVLEDHLWAEFFGILWAFVGSDGQIKAINIAKLTRLYANYSTSDLANFIETICQKDRAVVNRFRRLLRACVHTYYPGFSSYNPV